MPTLSETVPKAHSCFLPRRDRTAYKADVPFGRSSQLGTPQAEKWCLKGPCNYDEDNFYRHRNMQIPKLNLVTPSLWRLNSHFMWRYPFMRFCISRSRNVTQHQRACVWLSAQQFQLVNQWSSTTMTFTGCHWMTNIVQSDLPFLMSRWDLNLPHSCMHVECILLCPPWHETWNAVYYPLFKSTNSINCRQITNKHDILLQYFYWSDRLYKPSKTWFS